MSEKGPYKTQRDRTPVDPDEVRLVDREVLQVMPVELRKRLTIASPDRMTLRQMHNAGGAYLASLVCHPSVRRRVVEAAIRDPLAVLKIASSERPKESLVEIDTHKTVVVLPAQVEPGEWDKQAQATLADSSAPGASWEDEEDMYG